jgi:hypothetical protein
VLLEIGLSGGRTGCRTHAEATTLAARLPCLCGTAQSVRIVQPVVLRASRSRCACCTSASA